MRAAAATGTTTTTTMTTTITPTDAAALTRLLSWLSPAFPVGGFAYSHGLEWAVEAGDVRDSATLSDWIAALLAHGSGRTDAILLAHAHRAAGDDAALDALAETARALAPSRERLLETTAQGRAFAAAVAPWAMPGVGTLAVRQGAVVPYAIAVGAACGAACIPLSMALPAWLNAFAAWLISAAVRLVPLGQAQGLRVQAALEPRIIATAAEAEAASLDEIGGCCFRADLASLRHETQYTRLFRS
jgi:urease accessory protein